MGLTHNYKEYRRVTSEYRQTYNSGYEIVSTTLKNTDGDVVNFLVNDGFATNQYASRNYCLYSDTFAKIGSGQARESSSDYELNEVISNGSITNFSITFVSEDDVFRGRVTFRYNNTTANDITVKEIGVYKSITYDTSVHSTGILLARHVLQTPVVVTANSSYLFTLDILEE